MSEREARTGTPRWRAVVVTICCLSISATAAAEEARPVDEGASTGYELALHGAVSSELGQELRLFGVATRSKGFPRFVGHRGSS